MKFFIPPLLFGFLIIASSVQADSTLPEKQGCTSCHRFSSDESKESLMAPDLFYAGNKFQKSWLEKFLQNPVVIRKAGTINDPGFLKGTPTLAQPHPSLPESEALQMAEFILSLSLPDLAIDQVDDTPLTKVERVRTKILFERNYGCIACHEGINLAGQARGGISGPSLANAGNRLQADWVFNKLKTPEKFLAKSRMPLYKFDDATAIKLTKYMMTLKIGDWK
jgi:cytochrome c551/c552